MKALAIFISFFFYLNLLNASTVHPGRADEIFSPDTIKIAKSASLEEFKEAFNKLVKPDKDINQVEKGFDFTSLYFAVLNGKADIVEFLLKNGSDPNARIYSGQTALMSSTSYPEITQMLIEAGAEINAKAEGYFTALESAVFLAEPRSVQMLIEKGADVNARTEGGRSLFHLVSEKNIIMNLNKEGHYSSDTVNEEYRLEIAKLLLDKGLDPSLVDKKGKTALHEAAEKNRPELAEFFLRNNLDVNAKDETGKTALHWAAQMNSPKVIELLLENGAEHRVSDLNGWNPLHYAAANADFESGKILIEQGFNLNEKNKNGNTPLHLLAFGYSDYVMTDSQKSFREMQEKVFGDVMGQLKESTEKFDQESTEKVNQEPNALARKLHEKARKSNQRYTESKTPLMGRDFFKTEQNATRFYQDTQKQRMNFMNLLIKEGIGVNEQNNLGNTALHLVSKSKNPDKKQIANTLIKHNANLNIKNNKGELATSNLKALSELSLNLISFQRKKALSLWGKSKRFAKRFGFKK